MSVFKKALTQEDLILAVFKARPDHGFTSWEMLKTLQWDRKKITSVRRAMSNLCDPRAYENPPVEKTSKRVIEKYGFNHLYQLK